MEKITLTEEESVGSWGKYYGSYGSCTLLCMSSISDKVVKDPEYYHVSDVLKQLLTSMFRDLEDRFIWLQQIFDSENPKAEFEKFRNDFFSLLPAGYNPFPPFQYVSLDDFTEWRNRLETMHIKIVTEQDQAKKRSIDKIYNYFRSADNEELLEQLRTQAKKRLARVASKLQPESLKRFTLFIDNLLVNKSAITGMHGGIEVILPRDDN